MTKYWSRELLRNGEFDWSCSPTRRLGSFPGSDRSRARTYPHLHLKRVRPNGYSNCDGPSRRGVRRSHLSRESGEIMTTPATPYDLARASRAVYQPWVRLFSLGIGAFIILISLPFVIPVGEELQLGQTVSSSTVGTFLSIVLAAYPVAGIGIAGGLVGAAPRPVGMILEGDRIWLISRSGHRTAINWTKPRFRLILWDQSVFAARAGPGGDPGFRMVGLLWWRAILTREAFDALVHEATSRGLSVVHYRPGRWTFAASTPGTIVYRISQSPRSNSPLPTRP